MVDSDAESPQPTSQPAKLQEVFFDAEELEDAKWFDKAFVAERLKAQGDSDEPPVAGDFHVPSRISLARTLFEAWLAEE